MMQTAILRELAAENHGIISLEEAEDAGVTASNIRKLAQRGRVRRVAQGVYRHQEVPGDTYTDLAAALATVGGDAYIEWDSVLAHYGLGDIVPPYIRVGSSRRYRGTQHKISLKIEKISVPSSDRDVVLREGVPMLSLEAALEKAAPRIPRDKYEKALADAVKQGYLSRSAARKLKSL